ncbi:TIGR00266 family protein [Haloferula helveola]|uniref:TIGR00266 family protein n=1 Tax=Haloferula helveola TaxID=490095 RepID=A0ABM7RB27_9BACT|nr:TIGR00266 family protein [Haloferula helveola]
MDYRISGEIAQQVEIHPQQGDAFWCSRGSLMAFTDGIYWTLKVPGGVGGAVRRSLSGEGIALTRVEARKPDQKLLLASSQPGHIAVWDLADGPVVTTRGSFLAAWGEDVDISVTVARRAGAALFGGAGLFLQQVSGKGTVLIHGSGDFSEQLLAPGEEILVSTGHLAAFGGSIDYDIRGVSGCRKMLFGGEGLFMTSLRGPGRVLLQTLKRGRLGTQAPQ